MFFTNFEKLTTTSLRRKILSWADYGIRKVTPREVIGKKVRVRNNTIEIGDTRVNAAGRRIFVIGCGKASGHMASALEGTMGAERIQAGVVVSDEPVRCFSGVNVHCGTHPVPSDRSVFGAKKILGLKSTYTISEDDLIIALISGGGSALMSYPAEGITLREKQMTCEALIRSGANVHEMTTVKKKISQVKGGRLAHHFYPTPIISLTLSDVVGNDLQVIASGPLAKDETTFKDAMRIIDTFRLRREIPNSVLYHLETKGAAKSDPLHHEHVQHHVLADNDTLLDSVEKRAVRDGVHVVRTSRVQGEARDVARSFCKKVLNEKIYRPTLFLYGGETTVTLSEKHGIGGRNQEFALACLDYMGERPLSRNWCIASIGSDGVDFIKESAGGIIDNDSFGLLQKKGIDIKSYLENHDSHNLLKQINSNIYVERATGTNVCDIMMILLYPRHEQ